VLEAVTAAWDKVSEDWQNQARHDALMQLAIEHDQLKWVAGKYRERKGDAIADAQLVKLTNAAVATMMASATSKRAKKDTDAPYKRALVWFLLLAVMVVFGLIALKLMASAHHPSPP
jgi:hypothetical protein